MLKRWGLLCGLCVFLTAFAADEMIKVLELHYRSAEEVIPLLKPVISKDTMLSGNKQNLIVKATPEALTQIRALLQQLDKEPRSLIIHVRHDKPEGISGAARVISTAPADHQNDQHTVRVLEGEKAFVKVGSEVPVITNASFGTDSSNSNSQTQNNSKNSAKTQAQNKSRPDTYGGVSMEYKDVSQGFSISPTLLPSGKVRLAITEHRQTQDRMGTGEIHSDHSKSSLIVRLDQWVMVSQTGPAENEQKNTIVHQTAGSHDGSNSAVWIMVQNAEKQYDARR